MAKWDCAARHLCELYRLPLEHYSDTGKPRHVCLHCRKACHALCALQWIDERTRSKADAIFDLSLLHPKGRKEVTSFNNDKAVICFFCIEQLKAKKKANEEKKANGNPAKAKSTRPASAAHSAPDSPAKCTRSASAARSASASAKLADLSDSASDAAPSDKGAPSDSEFELVNDEGTEEDDDSVKVIGSRSSSSDKIWDDPFVNKVELGDGKMGWHCGWCNKTFKTVHATRVICHLLKIRGNHIATCGATISLDAIERYKAIRLKTAHAGVARATAAQGISDLIDAHQETATEQLLSARGKVAPTNNDSASEQTPITPKSIHSYFDKAARNDVGIRKRKSAPSADHFMQPSIRSAINKMNQVDIRHSNNSRLTMAIADLIHSDGLAFSICESARFKKVLKLAATVEKDFVPPHRKDVAGRLLKLNYETRMKSNKQLLLADAETYGLQFIGDGATIKRMPFLNVLAMCGYSAPVVLNIHDCTEHMAKGGKKDAPYVANLFQSEVDDLGPQNKFTNLFIFDGASNVQKAGEILRAIFPGSYSIHGGKHVISLFFNDISKFAAVQVCLSSCTHI